MIKCMRREYLLLLAACLFGVSVCCHQAEAGEYTDFDPSENAGDPVGGDISDDSPETGILLVENPCDKGDLVISCSFGVFAAEWDFSDMTLPLGEMCVVQVTPHEGFAVESVLFDGEPLEPGEDGSYSLALENETSELAISYVVSGASEEPDGETAGDAEGDRQEENAGGEQAAESAGYSGEKSASDVSFDINVLHRNGDETAAARTEPFFENGWDASSPDGDPSIADVPVPTSPYPEEIDDYEQMDPTEPVKESVSDAGLSVSPESSGKKREDTEIAAAELSEEPGDTGSGSAVPPASVSVATAEVQEPSVPARDENLFYILIAGAVLSILSAYAVGGRCADR